MHIQPVRVAAQHEEREALSRGIPPEAPGLHGVLVERADLTRAGVDDEHLYERGRDVGGVAEAAVVHVEPVDAATHDRRHPAPVLGDVGDPH